jgi:hypothetical protein
MTEIKNANKILARKHVNGPFGRPNHTRKYNIKINIMVIGYEVVDWIHVGQDRVHWRFSVYTVMNL